MCLPSNIGCIQNVILKKRSNLTFEWRTSNTDCIVLSHDIKRQSSDVFQERFGKGANRGPSANIIRAYMATTRTLESRREGNRKEFPDTPDGRHIS